MKRLACLLLALSAGLLGASASLPWYRVNAIDDKTGAIEAMVRGATWSKELTAIALALGAACIAGLALRRIGRRIVGAAAAVIAALGALPIIQALGTEASVDRMHKLLAERDDQGVAVLTTWAQISDIQLQSLAPILGLLGCALAVFGGALLAWKPGKDQRDKYQRAEVTQEQLDEDPDSERALWDAMDADIDPTDR